MLTEANRSHKRLRLTLWRAWRWPRPIGKAQCSRGDAIWGAAMPGYSIVILICSTALSHSDCQPNTALDFVRGPQVDNPVMCALNAQAMLARTDLVQVGGAQYMKVVCARSENADQWKAEIEGHNAASLTSSAARESR
jgi:hypothetical protein